MQIYVLSHIWLKSVTRCLIDYKPVRKKCPRHDDITKWKHVAGPLLGNPPVTGGFRSQKPVTRDYGVFFDLCLNKQLSKQ